MTNTNARVVSPAERAVEKASVMSAGTLMPEGADILGAKYKVQRRGRTGAQPSKSGTAVTSHRLLTFTMPAEKRSVSPTAGEEEGSPTKRPKSLHQWLHPDLPAPLMAHSPALHDSTSTFLSFSLSLVPPAHVTSEASLAKEAKRMIRELDVPRLVSEECMRADEGAFQDGEGRIGRPGQERIREPDHRMWACRALCLKEGADGTKGEHDYQASPPSMAKLMRQLLESLLDDGEKFGGDRVLRVLKEQRAVDVLTVCCRWVSSPSSLFATPS